MAKIYRGKSGNGVKRTITVVSDSKITDIDSDYDQPYGTIDYKIKPRSYITNFAPDDDNTGYSSEYLRHVEKNAETPEQASAARGYDAVNRRISTKKRLEDIPQPDQLFTEIKPQINVGSAFAHPNVRAHMGTMFGVVLNEHGTDAKIQVDESLSVQSSRLAHRAKEMGLNVVGHPNNPNMEVNNLIDDDDTLSQRLASKYNVDVEGTRAQLTGILGTTDHEQVHPAEVAAGRQTMRNLVNKGKTAKPKSNRNPNQLSLFDDNG